VTEPSAAAERASRSSFYSGMRILPRGQREAMYEIYSFCRAVDDIADDPGPREGRRGQLAQWRADIDGMDMDVIADIRAPDAATLDLYCDRVACAVGRLSVRVFGLERDAGLALAHHLGRALQLTNILRDLDEDASMGRLYLPREALHAAGIEATEPAPVLANPALATVCAKIVELARGEFAAANSIMKKNPRRVVRAPRIMGEAYWLILEGLVARGFAPPRARVRVPRLKFLLIVLRNLM
jgi:presqualene diphosphate synthase